MTQTPPKGKRDQSTHELQHDDKRLRALRDILTILAHAVAGKIHDRPDARRDDIGPPPGTKP
ncbi:MAG: hypothetical protein R3C45_03980 [Phycisphaerales bacterium]